MERGVQSHYSEPGLFHGQPSPTLSMNMLFCFQLQVLEQESRQPAGGLCAPDSQGGHVDGRVLPPLGQVEARPREAVPAAVADGGGRSRDAQGLQRLEAELDGESPGTKTDPAHYNANCL